MTTEKKPQVYVNAAVEIEVNKFSKLQKRNKEALSILHKSTITPRSVGV